MVTISQEKVWMKHFTEEERNTPLPQATIYQHLKDTNEGRENEPALRYYGRAITHRELWSRIDECANAFAALGVKKGDIVSLLSGSTPESLITLYAINKIGATLNCIDPRMDVKSIKRMIMSSGSSVLLVIDMAFPKVEKIREEIKQEHIIVQSAATSLPFVLKTLYKVAKRSKIAYDETVIDWNTFIKGGNGTVAEEAPYVGDATVAIAYTGGTTGFPKGVMLTNDSINSIAFSFKHCGIVYNLGEKFLGIMPIFSSYGMVCGIHMPLTMGLELVLVPLFVPAKIGYYIKKHRPNHMISTPAFYEILINSKEVRNLDLSFLVTLGSGGDTMNLGLETKLNEFMAKHNMRYHLAQGYGMSELSAAASFCVHDRYKQGSVGIPCISVTVSVFDPETGEELGYNQLGEICCTGMSMMKGYFNAPEETANVMRLHDDGQVWIHSGDLGYMDEDGFIFIQGRVKRMITRFDGHKVFPVNLEAMISEREDVHNCVVIGVNDAERSQGQYPMALVQFVDGVEDRDAACRKIFDMCNEQAEERGKPVAVLAIDEVPLTGMGKNDYRALEKKFRTYNYKAFDCGVYKEGSSEK